MKVAALAGGIGAGKFLRGLTRVVPGEDLTVVVNVADDVVVHGLHVSPDPDSVTYWLGDAFDRDRGWGRPRRDLPRERRARRLRPRAGLVRARRPRSRHPPVPHRPARRGRAALGDHRGGSPFGSGSARGCCRRPRTRSKRASDARARTASRSTSISRSTGSAEAGADPVSRCAVPGSGDSIPGAGRARGDRDRPTSSCSARRTRSCRSDRSSRCPGFGRRWPLGVTPPSA